MKSPKVSVGIISYNHAPYLPLTIESVLSQTFQDIEIIIVEDGSTDESLAIARSYAEKHSNVRVVTHPNHVNRGISATCNLAVTESSGDYIAIIGSDDIYYPHTIEEQVIFLESNASAGMVCGNSQYIDQAGSLLDHTFGTDVWSVPDPLEVIITFNRISAPSVMVRKVCYEAVGLYDEDLLYSDYDLWLRILLFSDWKIGYLDKFLVLYRVHTTNISVGISQELGLNRTLLVLLNIEKKLVENDKKESRGYDLIRERIANQYYELFCVTSADGEIGKSMRYFAKFLETTSLREITVRRAASIAYRLPKSLIKAKW